MRMLPLLAVMEQAPLRLPIRRLARTTAILLATCFCDFESPPWRAAQRCHGGRKTGSGRC
jgi:hypothetical protein